MQEPDRHSFTEYLFEQYNLTNRENIFSPIEEQYCSSETKNIETFSLLSSQFDSGLRDMIQYCTVIDAVSLTADTPIHLIYLLSLIVLKEKDKDLYDRHLAGIAISLVDLQSIFVKKKTITSTEGGDPFSTQTAEIEVVKVIHKYMKFSNMGFDAILKYKTEYPLYSNITTALYNERPRVTQSGRVYKHSLSSYPELIEQAGRIT